MIFPLPDKEYTVVVVVITYNHAPFIEEALKGIIMQQTNFSFTTLVLDDCSTDATADIVRKYEAQYPDLIKGVYFDENQYSQGKGTYSAVVPWFGHTKYFAGCEGDDYWTDPLKLQKQVDFMESHPDCKMSFHRVTEHWQDNSAPDKIFSPVEDRVYTGTEIFKQWVVATCSVMIRSDVFFVKSLRDMFDDRGLFFYDQALYMYCSLLGSVWGMSELMGVYRRVQTGFTSKLNSNLKQSYAIIERYCTHLKQMNMIFGEQLGEEFRSQVKARLIDNSLDGCLLAAKNKDIKQAKSFLGIASNYGYLAAIIAMIKKFARQIIK